MAGAVGVTGMKEFLASMKVLDAEAPKALRAEMKTAAEVVVLEARRRVPHRYKNTGRLEGSIRAYATARGAGVREGNNTSVPYAGFVDYGGTVGRARTGNIRLNTNGQVHARARAARTARHFAVRPYIKTGRIMYPAFEAKRGQVLEMAGDAMFRAAKKSGLEVHISGR